MRMRRDQRGYTIVELLIAVAILSIVVASVCGFIVVGSKSYAAGNSDINVQQEAQLALNQMSDVLIDTTRSVNYIGYDTSGKKESGLKDAEFSFTPEAKSVIMYNGAVELKPSETPGGDPTPEVMEGNGNKHYHFFWSKEKETLFYAELDVIPGTEAAGGDVDVNAVSTRFPLVTAADPDADPASTGWYVLASHVKDFSADLSQVEEKRVVQLALTLADGTKEYVTSNNVTIRNMVAVNDAELAPLNKTVEVTVTAKPSLILEPNEIFALPAPKVTGKNVTDKSVTWSLVNPAPADPADPPDTMKTPEGSSLTKDGILWLSRTEKAPFEVRATSKVDSNAHDEITINVKRVTSVTLAKTWDSAGNPDDQISLDSSFTLTATVNGTFLDQVCDCCGEDTSIDRQVLDAGSKYWNGVEPRVWRVWDPRLPGEPAGWENDPVLKDWNPGKYVDVVSSDGYSATFYLHEDAPSDESGTYGYLFQALSLLSFYRTSYDPGYRNYDYVMGHIGFTLAPKKDEPGGGVIDWGNSVQVGGGNADASSVPYTADFNKGGQGKYLVFARIRERNTPPSTEKLMVFESFGDNTWVTPDIFGVKDISRQWYISLQVLDPGEGFEELGYVNPGPDVSIPGSVEAIQDPVVRDVVKDYLEHSPNGTYNGTKYVHTGKYSGVLMPPQIIYSYNGKNDIEGELTLNKASVLGPETRFQIAQVKNTRGMRDGATAFTNNYIKYDIYKEGEKILWYDNGEDKYKLKIDDQPESTLDLNGETRLYEDLIKFVNFMMNAKAPYIEVVKPEKIKEYPQAAGKYQFVPKVVYQLNAEADKQYKVYYADYKPDYVTRQCHELKESTVYYELGGGGNLTLYSCVTNTDWSSDFTKGEIYFPTPSEDAFTKYFNRNEEKQEVKYPGWGWEFSKLNEGSGDIVTFKPSSMRCEYSGNNGSEKTYYLTLYYQYYDKDWNRLREFSAGTFYYDKDTERWEPWKPGFVEGKLDNGKLKPLPGHTAVLEFTMWGYPHKWNIYIPLPSEKAFSSTEYNGFGFKLKQGTEQSIGEKKLKYKEGDGSIDEFPFTKVSCTYNAAKDEYKLLLYGTENDSYTFICTSDGEMWTQQK